MNRRSVDTSATAISSTSDEATTTSTKATIEHSFRVRPYSASTDLQQVHSVFVKAMKSNERSFQREIAEYAAVPYGAWIVGCVGVAAAAFASSRTRQLSRPTTSATSAVVVATTAIMVAVLPGLLLRRFFNNIFDKFLQKALQDDLGNIEQVYVNPGGCFLVAVTTDGEEVDGDDGQKHARHEKIVGTVGGEYHGNGTYELRRMAVDPAFQNRGLGTQLVQGLVQYIEGKEEEEKEEEDGKDAAASQTDHRGRKLLYLTCSSAQAAAHALYRKTGFCQTRAYVPHKAPKLIRNAITIYRFEKELLTPPSCNSSSSSPK